MTDRAALRRTYGALFDRVAAILYEEDPVGLRLCGMPNDEYVPEAGTILLRLSTANSVQAVEEIVYEEFCRWFANSAGPRESYRTSAARIWKTWCSKNQLSADNLDKDEATPPPTSGAKKPLTSDAKKTLSYTRWHLARTLELLEAYTSGGKTTSNVIDGKLVDTTAQTIVYLKKEIESYKYHIAEYESRENS